MDEKPGANIDPIRGKLVTLAMVRAVRPDRALAEHWGGIWDVSAVWYGVHSIGFYSSYCNPVLLPSGAQE